MLVISAQPWRYDPVLGPKESLIAEVLGALSQEFEESDTVGKAGLERSLFTRNWSKAVKMAAIFWHPWPGKGFRRARGEPTQQLFGINLISRHGVSQPVVAPYLVEPKVPSRGVRHPEQPAVLRLCATCRFCGSRKCRI